MQQLESDINGWNVVLQEKLCKLEKRSFGILFGIFLLLLGRKY